MKIPIYQVDAFTSEVFRGNPAAICPLKEWIPSDIMQAIATENNLSETAFFVKEGGDYRLRWFTPSVEVDLCGHATLASAYVLFRYLEPQRSTVQFHTQSGALRVSRDGDALTLDFPARPPQRVEPCAGLFEALGGQPLEAWAARDYMILYETAEQVKSLAPDMMALAQADRFAIIVTAPGEGEIDFVSRFFAPDHGVPEDPVTGSAHCTLAPYWAGRLGKTVLRARQVSKRGGDLLCRLEGDRVFMTGRAAPFLTGQIEVDLQEEVR
jgi:PhzF family phenazine biosynthesis protein